MSTTSTVVVCEVQMSTMQSVLAALALGNQYSTPPKQFLRFNIAGWNGGSRVQATGWIETQMAFGQVRTQEMSSSNYHNNVMDFLESLGGQLPAGTVFPNHAYIGLGFAATDGNKGLRVTAVDPGSPAAIAGVLQGDVVTRLARERIRGPGDLLDGLRKAAKNPNYEIELNRDGQSIKLTLERAFREPAPAPNISEPAAEDPVVAMETGPTMSIADELAKFAKLRDDGIITAEEFEEQKAKLLGQ